MTHYSNDDRPVSILAEELGQRIEAYRLSQNLRQEDVSKLTGLSRGTIVRVESGRGGTIDSLIRILKALGVESRLNTLVPDARISPLEAKEEPQLRQRARPSGAKSETKPWTWGDE